MQAGTAVTPLYGGPDFGEPEPQECLRTVLSGATARSLAGRSAPRSDGFNALIADGQGNHRVRPIAAQYLQGYLEETGLAPSTSRPHRRPAGRRRLSGGPLRITTEWLRTAAANRRPWARWLISRHPSAGRIRIGASLLPTDRAACLLADTCGRVWLGAGLSSAEDADLPSSAQERRLRCRHNASVRAPEARQPSGYAHA